MSRILILYGGWKGHQPTKMLNFIVETFLNEHTVIKSDNLNTLNPEALKNIDLIFPIWTYSELTNSQENALDQAIQNGMGVIAIHGITSAFQSSRLFKFIIGGQFVAHPRGLEATYEVCFTNNDPLVDGLSNFTITTEQYYLLVDPAVKVLATSVFKNSTIPWIDNVKMPIAWKRNWNKGHVFYCSLGHTVQDLQNPSIKTLIDRAILWASNKHKQSTI